MQLYEQKFEEALTYLSRPDILNPTGDRPICYVNYDVEDAMEVYRMIPLHLIPKAKFHGFADVKVLSVGEILQSIFIIMNITMRCGLTKRMNLICTKASDKKFKTIRS